MIESINIIMCPSVSRYNDPPKDQPGAKIITCPHCESKMWISKKKRALVKILKNFLLICYDCLEKRARDGYFCDSEMRRIDI